jgi:hypothetical protein
MPDLDVLAADLSSSVSELATEAGVPVDGDRRDGRARPARQRAKTA